MQSAIAAESKRVDTALRSAESMISSQHYDDAVAAVAEFRLFARRRTAHRRHHRRGLQIPLRSRQGRTLADQKWHDAVEEYQKASDLKPTSESAAALKQAQAEFLSSTNRLPPMPPSQQSAAFEQDKHYIEAYEVLADLPDAQRALVKDQMQSLEAELRQERVGRSQETERCARSRFRVGPTRSAC